MTRSIVIGDVHGCYYTLMRLLDKLDYSPSDHLYFLGDLVGKGKNSAQVMDFMLSLDKVDITLGNHDIYWMYRCCLGPWGSRPDFDQMDNHNNKERWLEFFKRQNFLIEKDFGVLVHASVRPEWTIEEAVKINDELVEKIRDDVKTFLKAMSSVKAKVNYSNDTERLRSNLHALTQCRFYRDGEYSSSSGTPEGTDEKPWYNFSRRINKPIIFGHWAALRGRELPNVIALDGGAVYDGKLIAYVGETEEKFSVDWDKDDT